MTNLCELVSITCHTFLYIHSYKTLCSISGKIQNLSFRSYYGRFCIFFSQPKATDILLAFGVFDLLFGIRSFSHQFFFHQNHPTYSLLRGFQQFGKINFFWDTRTRKWIKFEDLSFPSVDLEETVFGSVEVQRLIQASSRGPNFTFTFLTSLIYKLFVIWTWSFDLFYHKFTNGQRSKNVMG